MRTMRVEVGVDRVVIRTQEEITSDLVLIYVH